MVTSAISQLTREERVQVFGIDCPNELVWVDWKPGYEQVKELSLQNVSLVTQKLRVNLPSTQEFDMPYPTIFKLSPGMTKKLPIAFRPVKYSANGYVDTVRVSTKGGDFVIVVHARVKDTAGHIPAFFDFGMQPVPELQSTQIQITNTGNYPLNFSWDANVEPFSITPLRGTVPVAEAMACCLSFQPKISSVYDAMLILNCTGEGDESGETKKYKLEVTGTGKVPYLQLLPCYPSSLNFGSVLPNNSKILSVEIQNVTPVHAPFKIQLPNDSLASERPPTSKAAQLPFSVAPNQGVIEAGSTMPLTFKFQSSTVEEICSQRFEIVTGGLTSLSILCTGHCKSNRVVLSTNHANFGEVEVGTKCSYVIKVNNEGTDQVQFHFINHGGFVKLDREHGTIPPNSFVMVTAYFTPLLPLNYYVCLYCIVYGSDKPIPLHIMGTAYTETQRPAKLKYMHIDNYRFKCTGKEEDVSFFDLERRPWDKIGVSPTILDFGKPAAMTTNKLTVTVTNTTAKKVTCTWMIPNEAYIPEFFPPHNQGQDSPPYTIQVYPLQADIRPRSEMEFQVFFKTHRPYAYEGFLLQAIVNEKINRNFRLVEADKLVPPWCINVQILGHSMTDNRKHEPQISISDDSIRFRPVTKGKSSFQVININNHGDNSLSYQLQPPLGPASDSLELCPFVVCGSMSGLIKPHHFHNIVLQFVPEEAKNKIPFRARLAIIFNFDEDNPKFVSLIGRCWEPYLQISPLTFPQTCVGASSTLICDVRNVSEIPVDFKLTVPKKFQKIFTLQQTEGHLLPLQESNIVAQFSPQVDGVTGTVMSMSLNSDGARREMAVQMLGHARIPALSLEPQRPAPPEDHPLGLTTEDGTKLIDFGPIEAKNKSPGEVLIVNNSDLIVMWRVEWTFSGETDADHARAQKALHFENVEGQVAGRCTFELYFTLNPPSRGNFVYDVKIVPLGGQDVMETAFVPLRIAAEVVYPYIQIVDIRAESANPMPPSLIWNMFRTDEINELFLGDITLEDRAYQAASGCEQKNKTKEKLLCYQIGMGTAALWSQPTHVYVAMTNPGKLPIRYSVDTGRTTELEKKPAWAEVTLPEGQEHYDWVEEHKIYEISPMEATIEPGSFIHLRVTYNRHAVGLHVFPIVFNVHNGKSIRLFFKGSSIPANLGKLSIRSPHMKLQAVPIGTEKGPIQVVELANSGAVSCPWRVNMESIQELNEENYDFEVLSVYPQKGVIDPTNLCYIRFVLTALEVKTYTFPIQIEMLQDDEVVEQLSFEVEIRGYDPRKEDVPIESFFPKHLPIQTYAPVPNCGCALSVEELQFGHDIKIPAIVQRISILVNYTENFILNFHWCTKNIVDGLTIEPEHGELSPGSHMIILFNLGATEALDISAEVQCLIDWTHAQEPTGGMDAATLNEEGDDVDDEEIIAFHKDHVHEPAFSNDPLLAPRHISVLNRLTATRFRALMSTAAGQKFLNNNLHQTAFVSSHLPRALNRDENAEHHSRMPPPSNTPMYVRLMARTCLYTPPPAEPRRRPLENGPHPLEEDNIYYRHPRDGVDRPDPNEENHPPAEVPYKIMEKALNTTLSTIFNQDQFLEFADSLVRQETPYFTQFDPTGLPTLAAAQEREEELLGALRAKEEARARAKEARSNDGEEEEENGNDDEEEEEVKEDDDVRQATWVSTVLMDFQRPKRIARGDLDEDEDEDYIAASRMSTPTCEAALPKPSPDGQWDQVAKSTGEIDLDDFQGVAGDVFSRLVLESIGEVINGTTDWGK